MSQIFEALRRAEDLERARKRMQGAAETGSMERRRAKRPALHPGTDSNLWTWAGFEPLF